MMNDSKLPTLRCQKCSAIFSSVENLTKHTEEDHLFDFPKDTRRPYECEKCDQKYISLSQMKVHLLTDCGKDRKHLCATCGAAFLTPGNLLQHRRTHDGSQDYLCGFCGKCFVSKGQLKVHVRSHTKEKAFVCPVCGKGFAYRESLVTHSTIHTGIRPYICMCCKKNFSCIGNLLKHKRRKRDTCGAPQYNEVKKIAPRLTTKGISSIQEQSKSSKKESVEKNKDSNVEETCQTWTWTNDEIKIEEVSEDSTPPTPTQSELEVQSEHEYKTEFQLISQYEGESNFDAPMEVEYLISEVEEKSVCNENLNKQTSISVPDNEFMSCRDEEVQCQICGAVFNEIQGCIDHLRKNHSSLVEVQVIDDETKSKRRKKGQKPKEIFSVKPCFKCEDCNRVYAYKSTLTAHQRANCGRNPEHMCDTCGKAYSSKGSLKSHKRVHTGELKFSCSFCNKKFRTAGQVKTHSRVHTKEKPYQCSFCAACFAFRESLLTHETTHTGEKRFGCQCGQKFSCITNLKSHRKSNKNSCGTLPLDTRPLASQKENS